MFQLDFLVQQQFKLNKQAVKCNDLVGQIEQLATVCNNWLKTLEGEEKQTVQLEQELAEARNLNQQAEQKQSHLSCTTQSKESVDSGSMHISKSDGDSSTMKSSLGPNTSMEQECKAIEYKFSKLYQCHESPC
jgi:hypothetical protein